MTEYVTVWENHEPTKLRWNVPVVRCMDCEQFAADNSDHDYRSGWWCHRWDTDRVVPDGFCAWGERKAVE